MFALRHVDANGNTLDLMIEHIEPLTLSALAEHFEAGKRRITTTCRAWPAHQVQRDGAMITSLSMTLDDAIPFLALVPNGALPAHYIVDTTLLLDRNVVDMLKKDKHAATFAWLDDERNTINPIMDAFEGETRTTPTLRDFLDQVQSVARIVALQLPKARMVSFDDQALRQMHAWRESFDERAQRETQFLLAASPLLANPVKTEELATVEQELLAICDRNKLRRASVIVVAVLAQLYEGTGKRPIRRLFKFAKDYDEGDAYNTLADLRQIELMAAANRLPDSYALLTQDQGMTALWCGLSPTAPIDGEGPNQVRMTVTSDLFPRLPAGDLREPLRRWGVLTGT